MREKEEGIRKREREGGAANKTFWQNYVFMNKKERARGGRGIFQILF